MCVRSIITYYYEFGVDKLHFLIRACFNVKEYTIMATFLINR